MNRTRNWVAVCVKLDVCLVREYIDMLKREYIDMINMLDLQLLWNSYKMAAILHTRQRKRKKTTMIRTAMSGKTHSTSATMSTTTLSWPRTVC